LVINKDIDTVHLIFKTHLDVGYTDYASAVKSLYFSQLFPDAINLARELRERGGSENFVWTTGSWIISEYLRQATPEVLKIAEDAIRRGDLVWHGLPFTTHTEFMDAPLFEYGLSLSQELDKRFAGMTIAAKMTDVPGHTKAMLPLLAKAGIKLLHIGVNPASRPPSAPRVFLWKQGAAEVVVIYGKGTYGGVTPIPEIRQAIVFEHFGDNRELPSAEHVISVFRRLRKRFPGATVKASNLNAFAERIWKIKSSLPVVTGEIGDTWIHCVGTDPLKTAQYRELCRLRSEWLTTGRASLGENEFAEFSRFLLVVPEHTWGMDEKTHLDDYRHYASSDLPAARKLPNFKRFEASWAEQRAYVTDAVKALGDSDLGREAKESLSRLTPVKPDKQGFQRASAETQFDTAFFEIGFDSDTGAISLLRRKGTGRQWASRRNPLGLYKYQTFSQADYDMFFRQYFINLRMHSSWAIPDFTKPGIEAASPESRWWLPRLAGLYARSDGTDHRFLVELAMPDEAVRKYGCPALVTSEIRVAGDEPVIHFDLQWFDKQACRLPEASWFSFCPRMCKASGWTMDKLGQAVSPLEVIRNGNRKMHAVGKGVSYTDGTGGLAIETFDAALVAPGEPSLLNFNNRQPPLRRGMHFNLYNNVPGTNFPMWYEDDARFRFALRFAGCVDE